MSTEYGLTADWLNSRAMAFLPDDAQWMAGPEGSSAAIEFAVLPTLAAMKVAAERQKDILDLGHIANAMHLEDPEQLVQLAYAKYGEDSIALSQGRSNYEIVAKEAMDATRHIKTRIQKPMRDIPPTKDLH